jgi:hypothetical protein
MSAGKNPGPDGGQLGLRLENTPSKGHQLVNPVTEEIIFRKSYIRYFPSVYWMYKIDRKGNHTLVLSYGKRIRRPDYGQLNAFLFFKDQYSLAGGNPNLLPGAEQAVDLRYAFQQFASASFTYSDRRGGIEPVSKIVGNQFITRYQNFDRSRFGASYPICRFL